MPKSIRILIFSVILIFSIILFPITSAHALTYPAEINQSFSPIAIVSGATSVLRISIYNPNVNQLTAASWSNDLQGVQPGLSITSPLHITNTCGGSVTAISGGALAPGGTTIALSGGTVPPQVGDVPGSCYVEVDVTSTTPGNIINTIPAYGVAPSYNGVGLTATTLDSGTSVTIHNTTPASATLNVVGVQSPSLSKSFAPNTIYVGATSILTIRVTNNDTKNSLNQTTLTDFLPTAGDGDVVVSNPVTTTLTGCGSATLTDKDGNPLVGGTSASVKLNNGTVLKSSTCTITVVVTSLKQGSYTNTIPAGPDTTNPGAIHTQEGVTNTSPASDTLAVQAFDITKSFTATPGYTTPTIAPGDTNVMTITIHNVASIDYTGATLNDQLPTGLEYDTLVTPSINCVGGISSGGGTLAISSPTPDTLSLTNGTLPAGSTCTIAATVKARMDASEKTYTNNIPIGSLHTSEGATNHASASANLDVKSLWISKDFSPTTFAAGQTSTLTIHIYNPSSTAFTGASLSDTLPTSPNSNLEFTGTPTTTCNPAFPAAANISLSGTPTRTVNLTNGTVPSGSLSSPGECTITATVTTAANASAVSYTGTNANTIPAGALSTTEGGTNKSLASADVSVTTISVGKAYSPGTVAYPNASKLTITITNPATGGALTGIHFTDTLNSFLEIVDSTSTPPSTNPATTCNDTTTPTLTATAGTQSITLTNGSLSAGSSSCTVTVYVRPKASTSSSTGSGFSNTLGPGSVTTNEGPTNSNTTTAYLKVNTVSVSKAFAYSSFESGAVNTLTITLTNFTGSDLHITSANPFSDTLPTSPDSNLEFTGTPTTTCSSTSTDVSLPGASPTRTVTLTNGTIPANGSCKIIATVTTVVGAGANSYTNTISVGALITTEGPSNTTAATAPVSVYVNGAGLTATKTFDNKSNSTISPGGISTLKLTFKAPPDTSLTNFSFTDALPTNASPVGAVTVVSDATHIPSPSGCGTLIGAWPPVNGANTISASGGTINIGATCTITVYVTANTGSGTGIQYTNNIAPADITNAENRGIPAGISAILTVKTPSTLTMTKAFYPTVVNPDGLSTLKITLTNTGASKLVNVTLDDILPDSLTNGVVVAPTLNESTTCTETGNPASITFPTTQTIHLSNGTIPAKVGGVNGICTINVDVKGTSTNGTSPATHHNIINPTDVTAQIEGTSSTMNASASATADLTVRNLDLEVVKGFVPQLVYGGAVSKMSIILRNPNSSTDLTNVQFTDNMWLDPPNPAAYPSGEMIIANPPNFDPSDCDPPSGAPAVINGTAGSSTFTFSGGYLAAGAQCTLTLDVTMVVNGNRTNTIPIGAVTTFNGAYNRTATSASLTNLAGASMSKSFSPNPVSAGLGSYSILTLTIRNTTSLSLTQLGLVDDLPAGLQVAGGSAPAPTNACGGTLSAPAGATTIQLSGGSLPLGFSNCIMTVAVTGANPGVYTNTIPTSNLTAKENPTVRQPAVDTLTLTPYSLGNRVWYDANNNGILDAGESGISGVTVNLYRDNGSTPGVYDSSDTFVGTQTTDSNGYYRFDNLGAGDYVVVIPNSNFNGGVLAGYLSSGTSMTGTTVSDSIGPSPNNDVDNDDNGVTTFNGMAVNYVSAQTVTLGPGGSEPTGETDVPSPNPAGEAADNQSNLTVDFGFYRLQLGNQIYADNNINGTYDIGIDSPLSGATVQLFASDGATEINVGPDGILGTSDDAPGGVTTGGAGTYLFSGLPQGSYIVKVLSTTYPSTVDTANPADTSNPNANADNNDNGVGILGGIVSSNIVTLTPGYHGSLSNNIVTGSTGTTYNPTVDFGYVTSLSKTIVSTSAAHTTGTDVTIGEVITYEVDMKIPAGGLNNVQLVDVPQTGLAFVDCVSVTMPANVTSSKFGTGGACDTSDGTTVGTSNLLIENSGGRITFDFGDITNSTGSAQIVKVQYSLIVLDVTANQNGDNLTNNVTWNWTGGTETTSAPLVKVVEPKMTIVKDATPTSVAVGDVVTFTIDVAHATQSTADAFDVVVTDQIPAGLSFVTGSLVNTGSATLTSSSFDTSTNILRLAWNVFHVNEDAHISFQTVYVGPSPVINAANVEWTSLTIDPFPTPPQLSSYNSNATARWYDPTAPSGVNGYGVSSSVTINSPQTGGLPGTGFKPGVITLLPPQPESLSYNDLGNIWLEIPRLNVKMPIVGIPLGKDGSWDLTWLGDQAGYLDGTAYPTHAGNSVLTAHVYMPNGQPGPFVNLNSLQWGDQVIVHFAGQRYVYEVREDKVISPQDVSIIKHEELPWLTLLTCKDYDAATDTYLHRVAVRAVLVNIGSETSGGH